MLTEWLGRRARSGEPPRWLVREIRHWNELESLGDVWQTLHRQSPDRDFFRSWGWFERYWHHFGQDQELRVLVVGDDADPVRALVPLTLRTEWTRIGPLKRLGFPLDNWGVRYGPVGSSSREVLAAAFRFLRHQPRDWDVIDLRWIPEEDCPHYAAAWQSARMSYLKKRWWRTSVVDLSLGWDQFWNDRTSKWRNNQRRSEKLLARIGRPSMLHFRPAAGAADPRWDLYDLCEQLAQRSWQGACPTGNTLNHPSVRDFLRDVHVAAVREGAVHLSLLLIDDRAAAFTYNYHSDGVVHGLRTGYDLQFQAAGPGAVLMRETVREASQHGDHTYHLGESPSAYKRHFANRQIDSFQFCHYSASSPRAHAVRLKDWLK